MLKGMRQDAKASLETERERERDACTQDAKASLETSHLTDKVRNQRVFPEKSKCFPQHMCGTAHPTDSLLERQATCYLQGQQTGSCTEK